MISAFRSHLSAVLMITLLSGALAEDAPIPLAVTDQQCINWIAMAIHEKHPKWNLKELRLKGSTAMTFAPDGPKYHAVAVFTSDQDDPNPLGPVLIWLGLFTDGVYVRLANHTEVRAYLNKVSKR